MMMYNMHYGWGMGWGWIVGLIILVAVLWLFFKTLNTNNRRIDQSGQKSALDILKERYAKGEISKEEYDEKRRDIAS